MSLTVRISKQLGDFRLQADFQAENESLALLGASGCGKSVTLRCIAGILKPDEGHIELDGQVLYDSAAHIDLPPQRRQVGYLFQQYALFPNMTVRQNIAVAVRDKSRREAVVAEQLRRFHLEDVANQRPRQLSGGQQQRTALARILASRPKAILLDEPFSALDSYLKYQLELELQDTLAQFPGIVLWVTHDRGEAWRSCRRVCVMNHGVTEPVMTMEELFRHPGTQSAARLSGCKNYVSAEPMENAVRVPDWGGVTLRCAGRVPHDVTTLGIRSHHVHPAADGDENRISCTVNRAIDDVFGAIVLLRPEGAADSAPLLRMELSKEDWAAQPDKTQITVSVAPENILLLK